MSEVLPGDAEAQQEATEDDDPAFVPATEHDALRAERDALRDQVREIFTADAALYTALAKAQNEYAELKRSKTVKVHSKRTGQTYTFDYAPLEALLEACVPALNKHGLTFTQPLDTEDGALVLRNKLTHEAGGVLQTTVVIPTPAGGLDGDGIKNLGSLITYLRRYCAGPMLGVSAEDDDDAGQASGDETVPLPTSEQRRTIRDILREAKKHDVRLGDAALSTAPGTRDEAEALIEDLRAALQEGMAKKNGKKTNEKPTGKPQRGAPQRVK